MNKINFKRNIVYCKYQRKFVNIDLCSNNCFILCKANKKNPENYQMNESEYNKYVEDNLPIYEEELNYIDSFGL